MTNSTLKANGSVWRRALIRVGLAYPPDGAPKDGADRRSRYGQFVSPRIDQDVDELRSRLTELENQLERAG